MMLIGLTASAFGQAVYLKVAPIESKHSDNYSYRSSYSGSFDKKVEREEAFNVTVKNMATTAFEYTVEWMFFANPACGGGKIEPFHAEEKKLSLEKNAGTTFEVRSPKLASTHSYSSYGTGNTFTGSKFAGYVVRVKIDDKILAVESIDMTLKRKYQDPKAKWGVPEESDTTKNKSSR